MKVRILSEPQMTTGGSTRKVRILSEPSEMASGGYSGKEATHKYGDQQPGFGYALNRFYTLPAVGGVDTHGKIDPFKRIGNTLPESEDGGDINAEKQERILGDFDQDGKQELMNVNGPSHAEGGKNLDVPEHSFVFSDTKSLKIKDPSILKEFGITKMQRGGYTPAEVAARYDLNKFKADPEDDTFTENTKKLMSDNYLSKLNKLAMYQEQQKASMGMEHHEPGMRMGGRVMQMGGSQYTQNGPPTEEQVMAQVNLPESYTTAVRPQGRYTGTGSTGLRPLPTDDTMGIPGSMNLGVRTDSYYPTLTQNDPSYMPEKFNIGVNTAPMDLQTGLPAPTPETPPYTAPPKGTPRNRSGIPIMDPNALGVIQNIAQLGQLRRFVPQEPVPQAVVPHTVFADPTRAIAALQESAVQGNEGNYGPVGRANQLARQGAIAPHIADTLAKYDENNVQTANLAGREAASITNNVLAAQRERIANLAKAGFLSDKEFQDANAKLEDQLVGRMQQIHENNTMRSAINTQSPYRKLGPDDIWYFNGPNASAKYYNSLTGGHGGSDEGNEEQAAQYAKKLKAYYPGISDDKAMTEARRMYGLMGRESENYSQMDPANKKVRISGEPVETPQRYGGKIKSPLMALGGSADLYKQTTLAKFVK